MEALDPFWREGTTILQGGWRRFRPMYIWSSRRDILSGVTCSLRPVGQWIHMCTKQRAMLASCRTMQGMPSISRGRDHEIL
eukprot:360858-Prorocentrum_lima.AAC.1